MSFNGNITRSEFERAYNKVKKGKKVLSDRQFTRFKTKDLNGLGIFFKEGIGPKNLEVLISDFSSGLYKIKKYTCVVLPKSSGGYRTIFVPSARDRIVFSILLEKLKKIFLEEINSYNVFGSGKRKDFKNIKEILHQVHESSSKHEYVLKIDIKSFFPSIDKELILEILKVRLCNEQIYKIVESSMSNGVNFNFKSSLGIAKDDRLKIEKSAGKGLPQGCAYSPLLANYYALPLDRSIKSLNLESFRYLDDMVVFANSEAEAKKALDALQAVAKDLSIVIHDISVGGHKTYIRKTSEPFEYLGLEVRRDGKFLIPISKIKEEIKMIKSMIVNQGTINKFTVSEVYGVLTEHIKGWKSYYKNNFPGAYQIFKNGHDYNSQLKKHYNNHPSFLRLLKKRKIDLSDESLYL